MLLIDLYYYSINCIKTVKIIFKKLNAAQNLLLNYGFTEVYNISGGYNQYKISTK
jgi:hypothetical protein